MRSARITLVALVTSAVVFAGYVQAATGAKPNLKVTGVVLGTRSVVAGGSISATATTANAGKKAAGKSATAFYLSADARKDARDRRLGSQPVAALKPRKSAKKTTRLTVPAGQKAGGYRLIACADDARHVRELKESDNCRVAAGTLTVTAPAPQPPAPPTDTPPVPTPPVPTPPTTTPPVVQTPSEQIQSLRDAPDGSVDKAVAGVVVTDLKPAVGADPAGFFVQAAKAGPALFVAVDPATLNPTPAVGDTVGFTATQMATVTGLREVSALTGFARTASGADVGALEQSVSTVTDLVSALGSYESELVGLSGTVTSGFSAAGSGYESAQIATTGVPSDTSLRLRLPSTVRAALGLDNGCTFTLTAGPVWRSGAVAEPSAFRASDITVETCPAPTVVSAVAQSATSVVVTFDRAIDPLSVDTNGSQFGADNGLVFAAASVSGSTVTLTSTAQTPGTAYTVTVAHTVKDTLGDALVVPDSAMFSGFVTLAVLKLNEISPSITGGHDLIELKATTGGQASGITIHQLGSVDDTLVTFPSVVVATGDLLVVHLVPAGATGIAPASETTSKTQYPNASYSANYDTAWDVIGGATGLATSARVLEVLAADQSVLDAVPVVNGSTTTAAFPGLLQGIQAAGEWLPADCGGAPCTDVTTPTAADVSVSYAGVGTTLTGNSLQRKAGSYTMQNLDWQVAASTFGVANA